MGKGVFRLSAFGDEISDELSEQLATLRTLEIGWLELRGVWGKNVLHLSDDEVARVGAACADAGIEISAIGSPVGKSPLTQPWDVEAGNLARILTIANALGVKMVRVFSFYPPEGVPVDDPMVTEVARRLAAMVGQADAVGVQLVLENENGIVGAAVATCSELMARVASPTLGFAWDPGNFVHVGEAAAVEDGWEGLGPRTQHVHIKDLVAATGTIVPAGEGDGQMAELLRRLAGRGYDGFLALEPHLAYAGPRGGFSGPDGMARAAQALRRLLAANDLTEVRPQWATGASR
jgi:sugar phosphate isomerase/epimerase